jgi:hypothetical protein
VDNRTSAVDSRRRDVGKRRGGVDTGAPNGDEFWSSVDVPARPVHKMLRSAAEPDHNI